MKKTARDRQWGAATVWLLGLVASLGLVACFDEPPGGLLEGEACRSTAQCGPGLECVGQVCVLGATPVQGPPDDDAGFAPPSRRPDADDRTPPDATPEDVIEPPDDAVDPPDDVVVPPDDVEEFCTPGERECASNTVVRVCRDDGQGYQEARCANGTFCQAGACEARDACLDVDGDGVPAGPGCPGQQDCNDANPEVLPGGREVCDGLDNDCDGRTDEDTQRRCQTACGSGVEVCVNGRFGACTAPAPTPEVCGDGVDNDCDGQVDENCDCCEPGGCPAGTLCVACECREAPRDECLFQNQPCNPFEAFENEDYVCIDFSNGQDGFCMGRCRLGAPDPDATCPQQGSICAFELEPGLGVCLDACDAQTQTGCFEDQGCIAIRDGGGCVPTGDGDEGEVCNVDEGVFDTCQAGLICTQIDQFDTTCERLCNPFGTVEGIASVCQGDTACFGFDTSFGLCVESLGQPEGSTCRGREQGVLCDDDVICHRVGRRENACLRLCRLDNGNRDCINGGRCAPSDFDLEGVGVCR